MSLVCVKFTDSIAAEAQLEFFDFVVLDLSKQHFRDIERASRFQCSEFPFQIRVDPCELRWP